jgi:tetratricopeptide (TPR) repeat protein
MGCAYDIIRLLLIGLTVLLLGTGFVYAAEIDDASIFLDAFAAHQRKDYLLAIEKIEQLNQLFPDSPLRDVVLLLAARSSYNAGDNERAAKTVTTFISEFPESSLKTTIEEDLLTLSSRRQKGETLIPDKKLQTAALKFRTERLAQERLAAAKLEQERLAKEKNELERIAREKAETERRIKELAAAEKAAKESIKVAVSIRDSGVVTAVNESGNLPVDISNHGKRSEEFILEVIAPVEYGAFVAPTSKTNEAVTRIKLAAGETFKGNLIFIMPADKVDGNRISLTIKVRSAVYNDVVQQKSAVVIASAPLVRVVAKLAGSQLVADAQLRYKVTILNVGSIAARMLTVRLQLPPQLDFQDAPDIKFNQEPGGSLIFRVEQIETGKLVEINLDVKLSKSSRIGQPMRSQVEIINGQLQRKDIFTVNIAALQTK